MNNQSTALEGGAMPSARKFNTLTTVAIAKSIKTMEYDMAKERVERDNVGKCNRLDKCGYHYTPHQYFTDNPWKREKSCKYHTPFEAPIESTILI